MFPLSWFPSLWFRVMDKRLLALPHVQGDLSRVNIAPHRRAELVARYGRARKAAVAAAIGAST
jgi:alkane 1-monooxygenase